MRYQVGSSGFHGDFRCVGKKTCSKHVGEVCRCVVYKHEICVLHVVVVFWGLLPHLFELVTLLDVCPARLDQRVQLRHEGDEPHQVAADEGDDER